MVFIMLFLFSLASAGEGEIRANPFQELDSFVRKGCNLSPWLRINNISKEKVILGNKTIKRSDIIKIYGKLKVGNYGVVVKCKEGYILIIVAGGSNGPSID